VRLFFHYYNPHVLKPVFEQALEVRIESSSSESEDIVPFGSAPHGPTNHKQGLITNKILNKTNQQTNKQKRGLLAATCKGDDNGTILSANLKPTES